MSDACELKTYTGPSPSRPQSGLGGIALYRDFLCQVVVPQDGGTRDGFLQFAECILLWLVPDPFHLLVGELPLPQRLGDVREVGEELRQVLDHSQQPLTPSDIRGPWHCTLVGSAFVGRHMSDKRHLLSPQSHFAAVELDAPGRTSPENSIQVLVVVFDCFIECHQTRRQHFSIK